MCSACQLCVRQAATTPPNGGTSYCCMSSLPSLLNIAHCMGTPVRRLHEPPGPCHAVVDVNLQKLQFFGQALAHVASVQTLRLCLLLLLTWLSSEFSIARLHCVHYFLMACWHCFPHIPMARWHSFPEACWHSILYFSMVGLFWPWTLLA